MGCHLEEIELPYIPFLVREKFFHTYNWIHSVLQLWLVGKKCTRYATIPIILFDISPIEIWSQTNDLTMPF